MVVYVPTAVCDELHRSHDLEDAWPDGDRDAVFAGPIVRFVGRTLAGDWNAVLDGDAILVVVGIGMALVADLDVAVEQRECERPVLGAFQDTIRWIECVEKCSGHRWEWRSWERRTPCGAKKQLFLTSGRTRRGQCWKRGKKYC